ncbi:dormancy-associated protein homolog 3 isoform X1 [Daucus carota subsp. sativus]|uniref:dormancy-associated protein homolog 3 isoform X1 n=1 Tax=Daucus carota subsp. sativus TaxID=79200 RepID=UPI0007EFA605|nr:PREDICTED: dormancy-associated protein homolog 3 isoform X1 [Daucus carota subsp. sativus]
MSLLDQLWDDTVAGPRPETGLGKLRKQSTFGSRSNTSGKELTEGSGRSGGENASVEAVKVTRSIMIVKPPSTSQGDQTGTPPASPAGSTPPVSPLSVNDFQGEGHFGFGEGLRRMRTRRQAAGLDQGALVLLMTCEM